jgi:hypothetical protein
LKANVRGVTFNLENGNIVRTKLESSSIFTENITENIERLRITMPDIKVGSVFDIEFTHSLFPETWLFQREIPVMHSELYLSEHPKITLSKQFTGFEKLAVVESDHWIAVNMPAFHPEPFISSPLDYITMLSVEIAEVNIQQIYIPFAKTWKDVSLLLQDHNYFGIPLNRDRYLNKPAEEIRASGGSETDRLRLAFDYIKRNSWNKQESLLTSSMNLSDALEKQSGNSADINLALIQLLRKLDFKVTPVLLSTRDHGKLSWTFPSFWKLNYVVALVELDEKPLLLDATEKNAPYFLLPERCLNTIGMTYSAGFNDVVSVESNRKGKQSVQYKLTLEPSLQFRGSLNIIQSDYSALKFRNDYDHYSGMQSYLDNFVRKYPGMKLEDYRIANIDSIYLPIEEEYKISLNNMVDAIDSVIYIYPMMLHRLSENPFKAEKRMYPVDYGFGKEENYLVSLTLPAEWELISWPKSVKKVLKDESAYFLYQITSIGNTIHLTYKTVLKKSVYPETEYPDLREFYNQIVTKHNEAILVKRK